MLLILMHVQNLVKTDLFILKIMSGNEILTSFKGRNFVTNWWKWTLNDPKLDVVNFNACAKLWSKSIYSHSRYWAETKFWSHSRAITLYWIDENWRLTTPSYMSSISMHMQNFVKIRSFIRKIFSGNEIMMSFKGHNSVLNWRKVFE